MYISLLLLLLGALGLTVYIDGKAHFKLLGCVSEGCTFVLNLLLLYGLLKICSVGNRLLEARLVQAHVVNSA